MSLLFKSLVTLVAVSPGFSFAAPYPDRIVEEAASGTQTALITVTPKGGEYIGDITVDGKVHKVVFDTGSDILWINNKGQKGPGDNFYEGYGSGSVNGTIVHGNVTIGGITIPNQAYGLVYHTEGTDTEYDGLIGLGTSSTQFKGHETSWLKNIMTVLKEPIFNVDLAPDSGTFAFGYSGGDDAGFLPLVTGHPGWDISVELHGHSGTVPCDLDTGTTDIYIPKDAYDAYSRGVNSDGSHVPDFEVTSNGHTFTMPGEYAGEGGRRIKSSGDNSCILGQPFISAFHVVYDYANKRVSLASKA